MAAGAGNWGPPKGADVRLHPLDVLILRVLQVTNAVGAEELPAEPEKVLLTGANGFLGRFLLLDFLKRVSTK